MKTVIIIPSRLSATRLPGKPLLKINGLSIISHVVRKAKNANIGEVYVATEDEEILNDVKKNGGQAIITSKNHKTGTDRICEALDKLKKPNIELVLNIQGDEPLMNIEDIKNLHELMIKTDSKLGTLASNIFDEKLFKDQNSVKVVTKENINNFQFSEATSFMRIAENKNKNTYHHLGIYCYQTEVLKKFTSLNQSKNEIKYKLEQLRALDNNMTINVGLAKSSPIGVDTEQDFLAIKKIMEYKI